MGARTNRARAVAVIVVFVLISCFGVAFVLGRFGFPVVRDMEHLPRAEKLKRFEQAFGVQRAMMCSSDPEKVKTLEDLARLDSERSKEFASYEENPVEYFRYRHEFYMRSRPPHEVDIILQALEDATRQQSWNLDGIRDACEQLVFGVYDIRVLDKITQIVKTLEGRYSEPESNEAAGQLSLEKNHALGVVGSVLRRIGHIGLVESADYLLNLIPARRPENPMRWERTVIYGALNGLGDLPPHLGIPALEKVYAKWFPDVPPGTLPVGNTESRRDFEYVLRLIDEAYRKGYNEPPIRFPWGGFYDAGVPTPDDWPLATYSYGPGGIKLPYP